MMQITGTQQLSDRNELLFCRRASTDSGHRNADLAFKERATLRMCPPRLVRYLNARKAPSSPHSHVEILRYLTQAVRIHVQCGRRQSR